MRKFSPRSQHGQALIETLLVVPVIASVLAVGALVLYLTFAKIWLTRAARETAICLVSPRSMSLCKARMLSTLKSALPWGDLEIESLRRSVDDVHVKLQLRDQSRITRLITNGEGYSIGAETRLSKNL